MFSERDKSLLNSNIYIFFFSIHYMLKERTAQREYLNSIDNIVTEKGSVYTYLPNGQTQRFKKKTNTLCKPLDFLVYIPPFEELETLCGRHKVKNPNFLSEDHYAATIPVFGAAGVDNFVIPGVLVDGDLYAVKDTRNNAVREAWEESGKIMGLGFYGSNSQQRFVLPVSMFPIIGATTCDGFVRPSSKGYDSKAHIGHKVTEINLKKE
jgi:hypothetical protein